MKAKIYHILVFYLLIWTFSPLYGQIRKTEQFDINDFLGERTFLSVAQGDDLILYFNTSDGILSYDGHDFNKISPSEEIKTVNSIEFFQNTLYIAASDALYQYFPDKDSTANLAKISVQQFKKFNNQLWLITEDELMVVENEKLKNVYSTTDGEKLACFELNNQITLLGHDKGLTLLEKGNKIKDFGTYLKPVNILSRDSLLYILSEDAIFEYKNDKIVRDFKYEISIIDFYIDDYKKTWFLDNQKSLRVNNLMNNNPIYSGNENKIIKGQKIFPDKENNLWILGENKLTKISQKNPFSKVYESDVLEVFTGKNSNLIIKQKEIIIYNQIYGIKKVQIPIDEFPLQKYYALKDEDRWIICLNQSIYSLNTNDQKLELIKSENKYLPIKKIKSGKYLAKYSKGDLFHVDEKFNPTKKIEIDPPNRLIIRSKLVYNFSNKNSINILDSAGNPLKKISIPDTININNVRIAQNGFWYYTQNEIYRINFEGKTNKINLNLNESIGGELILNAYDDLDENLWISSKNKLIRYPITEKNGVIKLQKPFTYNQNDFLFSTYYKDVQKDNSGHIWFIHENGISIYNPLREIPNLVSPSIKIESAFAYNLDNFNNPTDTIYLDRESKSIDNNAIVVIHPKVINHFNTFKSTIGYRNLRVNQSERRINTGEKIILTDLSDGLNTINLKAYNSNGIESEDQVNVNIYVKPPIWKQNWFFISSALSLLLLGFIGYRTVINIKNSRARELEDELHKGLEDLEKKSHLQILKAERLKQLNELITSQKSELEKKNKQIESQKYELSLTNQQIKKQKDLLEETSSKLTSSINYAKRIQNALMSTEVEIKKAFTDSFVYFLPRDVVSGDFFWFNKATNEKGEELLILAAVDCTGHGVPGAIVSVVGMNLLNNITKLKKTYDPGQILTEMNHDIITDLRQDETQVNDGMDMTIVTYNTQSKQLYFAGAKNPLMYVEDGELIRIKGDKHAIGGQQRGDDRIFNTHTLDLTDGKTRTFYLFSDGYQDQFGGEKGFKYLVGNFKKLLLSIHDKAPLDQKTILHEEIEDWKDGYAQTDDILVIGFKL